MWLRPDSAPCLFNSLCFGVFLSGLFVLLDCTAEAFADGLSGTQPSFLLSWVPCFAPVHELVGLLLYPLLGGIAHWRRHTASPQTAWLALVHAILAIVGGMAFTAAAVITQRLTYLNGARPISAGQVGGNILLLVLFVLAMVCPEPVQNERRSPGRS